MAQCLEPRVQAGLPAAIQAVKQEAQRGDNHSEHFTSWSSLGPTQT